ncbi:Alpha N-terminal protein methyltransferase 1 [Apostasia shenzhenica]|uniref:Alpha N-terminal protein methyltransferase 1 n=1 Tax=Apostasia shenzhenica TaxID=1088818 RepID=A0A2I0B9A8_9ASPA|nr:Alpha N-terminal protein methyltransferase 1 [Apostasia shenzhenica]
MNAGGLDSDGRSFRDAREMWREEIGIGEAAKRHDWYQKGISYWEGVEASVDGVLGGYGHVNEADVRGSEAFLKPILIDRFGRGRRNLGFEITADCGSGIGRITKDLLLRHFNEVDLLEPVAHFLNAAHENLVIAGKLAKDDVHRAVNFYCLPLQEFSPEVGRYDVIWIQWCIGHLPDDDFVSFFKRAKVGLKPYGFFVVKENVSKSGFVLDKEDSSITRSDLYFRDLFEQCGLYVYSSKDQRGFPAELFAVKMYALVCDKPKGRRNKQRNCKPAVIKC